MSDTVTKRNITSLHENDKIIMAKFQQVFDEVVQLKAQLAQVRQEVLQLRQQVLLSSINVGGGPTVGSNN